MANPIPDYATQLAMLQQRQKMAQMLQEQAAAPIEVQSYKGIQAPISNLSILAKALQGFGGAYLSNQATKDAGALQKQVTDQYTTALSTPDTVSVVPKLTAQSLQSFMSPTAPAAPSDAAPSVPVVPMPTGPAPSFSSDLSGAPQGNPRLAAALGAPAPVAAPEAPPVAAPVAPPMPQPFVPGPSSEAIPQRPMTGQEKLQRGAQFAASGNPMLAAYASKYIDDAHTQIKSEAALAGLNTAHLPENVTSQLSALAASGAKPEEIVKAYQEATKPMRVGDTVQQINLDTGKMDVIADARTRWEKVSMDDLTPLQRQSIPPGMVVLKSTTGDMKTVNTSDAQSIMRIQDDIRKSLAEGAPALALAKDRFAYDIGQKEAAIFPPNVIKQMAAQAWQGDKSVFQNLGRGNQGAQNIVNLRTEIAAQGQGRPPGDLARMNANFVAQMAEARAIGARSGSATFANAEIPQAVELSKEAYGKLPRGQFVPFNKLQRLVDTNTSSPEQAAAYTMDEDAIAAYARALNPNGIARLADIDAGRKLLSGANSIEAHNATLDAMQRVVEKRQAAGHALLTPQTAPNSGGNVPRSNF